MLGVLQLSDIHFIHDRDSPFNSERELQDGLLAFLPELRDRLGKIGLIVITGDVAFGGKTREYETADAFLHDVRSRLRDPKIPVRVIPGNHDIFRDATDSADQDSIRAPARVAGLASRERENILVTTLQDKDHGPALFAPLEAFNTFAAAFGCEVSCSQPYWDHRADLGNDWVLRLRGMNSVLLSNKNDDRDRMVLGGKLQTTSWSKNPGEVNLSLCHHPYSWLLDADEVAPRVAKRSHLHITGHVHCHKLIDKDGPDHLHLMAGAMQPPWYEDGPARFNGLRFEVVGTPAEPQLKLTVVAVRWDRSNDGFVFDEEGCVERVLAIEPIPGIEAPTPTDDPRLDRLRERLSDLPNAHQLDAGANVGMKVSAVLDHRPADRVRAILDHAAAHGKLAILWDDVEKLHGSQLSGPNPYRE